MRTTSWIPALLLFGVIVLADDPPSTSNIAPFLIQSAEERFETQVAKAEADFSKVKKLANEARLKSYKDKLSESTKAGDFDKAVAIKARIEMVEAESEGEAIKGSKKPRPKDTIKFGGHTYALIKAPAPWHVAKRRCEEMGGHLATLETPAERMFVESLCTDADWTWAGGTDEEDEGHWMWVTGKPITTTNWIAMDLSDEQHYLGYNRLTKKWFDCNEEHRTQYVCEWDR